MFRKRERGSSWLREFTLRPIQEEVGAERMMSQLYLGPLSEVSISRLSGVDAL